MTGGAARAAARVRQPHARGRRAHRRRPGAAGPGVPGRARGTAAPWRFPVVDSTSWATPSCTRSSAPRGGGGRARRRPPDSGGHPADRHRAGGGGRRGRARNLIDNAVTAAVSGERTPRWSRWHCWMTAMPSCSPSPTPDPASEASSRRLHSRGRGPAGRRRARAWHRPPPLHRDRPSQRRGTSGSSIRAVPTAVAVFAARIGGAVARISPDEKENT